MIEQFNNLTADEQQLLIKAPVLISVLVSCSEKEVNKTQQQDAAKLVHLRTFTSPPELHEYYKEVDKVFKSEFEQVFKAYHPFDDQKKSFLLDLIHTVRQVISKLPEGYGDSLSRSLDSYSRHVRNSTDSVLRHIIFPMAFSKLEERRGNRKTV